MYMIDDSVSRESLKEFLYKARLGYLRSEDGIDDLLMEIDTNTLQEVVGFFASRALKIGSIISVRGDLYRDYNAIRLMVQIDIEKSAQAWANIHIDELVANRRNPDWVPPWERGNMRHYNLPEINE